jgi:hypothetical protein
MTLNGASGGAKPEAVAQARDERKMLIAAEIRTPRRGTTAGEPGELRYAPRLLPAPTEIGASCSVSASSRAASRGSSASARLGSGRRRRIRMLGPLGVPAYRFSNQNAARYEAA